MSKFRRHCIRRDTQNDHVHSLPDGHMTMGMQMKPNANARAGWHTHLYQHDGAIYETDAAYEGGDHVHHAHEFAGMTSGPMTGSPQEAPKHRGKEIARSA